MATSTAVTLTLRGKSGTNYEFTVYPWGTQFKPVGAVYAVFRKESDGYVVVYIGQTADLSERFDDHHKQWCFDNHRKSHIGVHLESSEKKRLAIEQDLIANYHPPCNN